MKIAWTLAVSLLLSPAVLSAQEGVATYKYTVHAQSAAPNGESRVFFSPTAMRMEMQMNMGTDKTRAQSAGMPTSFKTTMIQKVAEPDKLYTINDERRTYSVMDLAEVRKSTPAPDTKYTVQRQGTDRVAGFSCEKALVTSSKGNVIEVCFSNEIAASSSWVSAMNRQAHNGNWVQAVRDAGLKGFPIRLKFRGQENPGGDITMELVSLEKKPVPASLFVIPAGYRETGGSAVQ